jgi:hypothetical protein
MKDKAKFYKEIKDFFGTKNDYNIFAVKSNLSLFPFTSNFEKITSTNFFYLTTIEADPSNNKAKFNVMYSLIFKEENTHCYIIENKTTQFANKEVIQASVEKKLSFQTLALFDDTLYLFNKEGLAIYKSFFAYYDYLILIHNEKNKDISSFVNTLFDQKNLKPIDVSTLLNSNNKKQDKPIEVFLQKTFCTLEVFTVQFHHNQTLAKIGPIYKIPDENIVNPLKIYIDPNITEKRTLNFNSDYLRLLTNDVDS